jgi:hypothetical protein
MAGAVATILSVQRCEPNEGIRRLTPSRPEKEIASYEANGSASSAAPRSDTAYGS